MQTRVEKDRKRDRGAPINLPNLTSDKRAHPNRLNYFQPRPSTRCRAARVHPSSNASRANVCLFISVSASSIHFSAAQLPSQGVLPFSYLSIFPSLSAPS